MKKLYTLACLIGSFSLFSQDWAKTITKTEPTFYDIQNAFNEYYKNYIPAWDADDDYTAFKRWENFMAPRVYPTGKSFNANATWQALQIQKFSANKGGNMQIQSAGTGTWLPMGPQNAANGSAGIGRIDCCTFDPSNSNNVWVGSSGGGLWKSTTGGGNWSDMSANLPNLSVADIAINPAGTNTMYIATGDGFGYVSGSGGGIFWGGTYSTGVMKSTDGGITWAQTPLSYTVGAKQIINRIIINPNNPNILLTAGTGGINRTTNGGTTWTQVKSGRFYDIEFKSSDPNTVYAVRDSVFKSTDAGATWSVVPTSPKYSGRVAIETTAAADSVIYVMDVNKKFSRSGDGGLSWSTSTIGGLTLYGYYDNVLSVSPSNKNTVVAAGFSMYKTTNGGASWTQIALAGIHVDHHVVEFAPGSATDFFGGNDGGIYRTTNGGTTWTNYTSGLQITQFYRLGTSATNTNVLYCGAQDNGTLRDNNGTWASVGGGDGMECLVDYTNANNVYISSQNGTWSKSTNGGGTFGGITPGTGAWTSPMVMHPTNPAILFYGSTDVKKSTNGGSTWAAISTNLTGGANINSLAVAKSNPNYIYAATWGTVFVTTNGGTTWADITAGLPLAGNAITYIAISGNDPQMAWVTLSGYTAGQKVFMTINGGATWTNESGGLPNIPANCITYDNNSSSTFNAIYCGTDLGVYYKDSTLTNWQLFSTGLPNVIIDELEINYNANKIFAATYGRGIWSSPINKLVIVSTAGVKTNSNTKSTISLYPNPNNGVFNLDINSTQGNTKVNVSVYNLTGELVYILPEDFIDAKQYQIDLSKYSSGVYLVKINTGFETRTERIVVNK